MNTHEYWPKFIAVHYFLTFKSASDVLYQVKIPVQNTYTSIYLLSQCVLTSTYLAFLFTSYSALPTWCILPLNNLSAGPDRSPILYGRASRQLLKQDRNLSPPKPIPIIPPKPIVIVTYYYYTCYQLWYGSDGVRFWIFMNPEWCQKRCVAAVNTFWLKPIPNMAWGAWSERYKSVSQPITYLLPNI